MCDPSRRRNEKVERKLEDHLEGSGKKDMHAKVNSHRIESINLGYRMKMLFPAKRLDKLLNTVLMEINSFGVPVHRAQ